MRGIARTLVALLLASGSASAAVVGRVVAPDGGPLAGATINGYAPEAFEERAVRLAAGQQRVPTVTARSSADGSFRLDTAHALLKVEARADRFAPAFVTAVAGSPVTLELKRAEVRRGVVKARARAVAGATVVWMVTIGADAAGDVVTRTASDGSYEIPDPLVWANYVVVLHPDFAPREQNSGEFGRAGPLAHELDAGAAIEGQLVDHQGQPLGGATVWLGGWSRWPMGRTAASGAFRIAHAPRDWETLTARGDGVVAAASRRIGPVTLLGGTPRTLSGTVTDEGGRALAGATISVAEQRRGLGDTTVTDARGQYTLQGLFPGSYRVDAVRPGHGAARQGWTPSEAIDLRSNAVARKDFVLPRQATVAGRVEDADGKPVGHALVTFGYKGTPHLYVPGAFGEQGPSARTAGDGSFEIAVPEWPAGAMGVMKDRPLVVLKVGYAAARVEAAGWSDGTSGLVVTLSRGIELRGRVTSADGSAMAGVAVTAAEDGAVAGTMLPSHFLLATHKGDGWTTSGPDGGFSLRVHPAIHHLSLRKAGHAPKLVKGHDARQVPVLEVALEPAASVRGRVVHADGRGVADVQVTLSRAMGGEDASVATATDGSFTLPDLAPGSYQLAAAHGHLGIDETRTVQAPGPDVELRLAPAATLRGSVVDAATGRPVPAFKVEVEWSGEAQAEGSRQVAVEDAAGDFTLADVPVGDVSVSVSAEGYASRTVDGIAVSAGPEAAPLEVALSPEVPIRGRVTSDGKTGIPDAAVAVKLAEGDSPEATTSDEQGEYELRGVAPGEVTLTFGAAGFLPERRTVDTTQIPRVDVTLVRGLTLRGEVVRDGVGVAGAGVTARSAALNAGYQTAQTDERGRFVLEGIGPGRYSVSAWAAGKGKATLEDVDVATAGPLRLALETGATAVLTGRVTGMAVGDEPVVAVVVAHNEENAATAQALVDAALTFRMEDAPAGRVKVMAYASSMAGATRTSRPVELALVAGAEAETTLEFTSDVVTGVVVRDGAPVPDVHVSFGTGGGMNAVGRTDARGVYEVMGLEPGSYTVQVMGTGVSFSTERVLSGSGQVDIDITAATIRGQVVRAEGGTPVPGVEVSLWRAGAAENRPAGSATTNTQGSFTLPSLHEGRYRLTTAKAGFGQEDREVEVVRGGAAEVRLELSPAEGVGLTVVDARDGRPLEAIVVVRDSARRIVANRHSGVADDGVLNIPLANGSYLLSTSASGYGTATLPVSAPSQGLRVGLTPGGTLVIESARDLRGRVRLVQPDGEEYVQCWCNGIADIQLKGRQTTVENVTPGQYTLELVDAAQEVAPRPVVIAEGQRSTVTIE